MPGFPHVYCITSNFFTPSPHFTQICLVQDHQCTYSYFECPSLLNGDMSLCWCWLKAPVHPLRQLSYRKLLASLPTILSCSTQSSRITMKEWFDLFACKLNYCVWYCFQKGIMGRQEEGGCSLCMTDVQRRSQPSVMGRWSFHREW